MELKPLSKEEIQILYLLESNSSVTTQEISERLSLKEPTVIQIKSNLEKEGIILKYKAFINWESLETPEISAIIEVNIHPESGYGYDQIAAKICSYNEVSTCTLVSGSFDLLLQIKGPSIKEVAFFIAEKLSVLPNVTKVKTNFLLKQYKQNGEIFNTHKKIRRLPIVI